MPISDRKCTLGREERLKSRKLIERVFRDGKSFALFPFRVFYLPVGSRAAEDDPQQQVKPSRVQPPLQAGFGASARNFKRAVDRNRIKRLTREAYRLRKQDLQDVLSARRQALALFFIYTGKELPEAAIVSEKIGLALEKLVKETGS